MQELYWRFLAAGLAVASIGALFLRERAELGLQLAAALASAVALSSILW